MKWFCIDLIKNGIQVNEGDSSFLLVDLKFNGYSDNKIAKFNSYEVAVSMYILLPLCYSSY